LAKKKAEKPKREVTKRQLSHWQQQRRRQRIILGVGIFIIVAVFGILGAGLYSQYQPLHQTVIRVNDTEFNMNYYIKMLKYYGKDSPSYYITYLANEVVKVIEQNELVRQNALELGISVSNDEVDKERKSREPPLSKDYRELVKAEMLINKLRDEYFDQKVPVSAEQRHIMAMLLESESQASEVRAKLEGGESFSELATELSLDSYSQSNEGDFGWRPKDILPLLLGTSALEEHAFSSEAGVLSQPIYDEEKAKNFGYWIAKVSERKEEENSAHIQAILLGSEAEAWEIRAKLEAGEDFAALAKEFSQHGGAKEDEGDLGWLSPGTIGPPIDDFAFNDEVELETLSEPLRDEAFITKGGYWLFKVLDIEDRDIEGENRDILKAKLLNEWIESLWNDSENTVESYLDDDKIAWALERV